MAEGALSTGDLALMHDNEGFGGNGGFFWVFALTCLGRWVAGLVGIPAAHSRLPVIKFTS